MTLTQLSTFKTWLHDQQLEHIDLEHYVRRETGWKPFDHPLRDQIELECLEIAGGTVLRETAFRSPGIPPTTTPHHYSSAATATAIYLAHRQSVGESKTLTLMKLMGAKSRDPHDGLDVRHLALATLGWQERISQEIQGTKITDNGTESLHWYIANANRWGAALELVAGN